MRITIQSALANGAMLLAALLLNGCAEDKKQSTADRVTTAPAAAAAREIDWFSGTIEEAFAHARARNKPLFLYWGAEWCPYCKQLQATIFVRDEFIDMSRQFVTLDMSNGDSDTIRKADEYRIYGLPTVIVFSPDGTELTRIPGGMNMDQYAAVLELTLNALRPVSKLLDAVQSGETLSDEDWELLAAYSWSQDRGMAMGDQAPEAVLKQLAAACPEDLPIARARLALSAAAAWMDQDEAQRHADDAALHLQNVNRILADPSLRTATLTTLAGLGGDMVETLATGEAQLTLQRDLTSLFRNAVADKKLNLLHRAAVLAGWGEVATALLEEGQTLPAGQIAWGRSEVAAAIAELSPYQAHAGINSLWGVYYELGLVQEARDALARGMEVSKTPFYFMSAMGYIEREAGDNEAALDWYRKAWQSTVRPLDRVRWGRSYVLRLLQLAPGDVAEIRAASSAVLADIAGQEHGIDAYDYTLERLSEALLEWSADASEERSAVLTALKAQVSDSCARLSEEDPAAATCSRFLQPGDVTGTG